MAMKTRDVPEDIVIAQAADLRPIIEMAENRRPLVSSGARDSDADSHRRGTGSGTGTDRKPGGR